MCHKVTIPKTQFPGLLKRLFEIFSPNNLKSGFRATGLFSLDRNQVLKRLPSCNSSFTADAECSSSALNEPVLSLLQTHCGLGKSPGERSCKRGQKIVSGKQIFSLQSTGSSDDASTSHNNDSGVGANDEQWVCHICKAAWEVEGDDRWIVCDKCNKQCHLQCCQALSMKVKTTTHLTLRVSTLNVVIQILYFK